ncbi:uncharacterized protein AKAME5_001173600 [Lates japonicus]|uniref:Uncharacterized protein n=1 Tax=Lates japonicus TaxID=270547 RepID=A0AAD3R790_LATJO|nr:uncharacterized protein AKAME5_001173600 [Lates japonicus]
MRRSFKVSSPDQPARHSLATHCRICRGGTRTDPGRESPGVAPAHRLYEASRTWRNGFPPLNRPPPTQCDVSRLTLAGSEGMRLRGGRDFNPNTHLDLAPPPPPPVAWLPGVLSKRVRLRLRLDRRDDRGRGCWHLVDLESESELTGLEFRVKF